MWVEDFDDDDGDERATPEQFQAIWDLDEQGIHLNVCPPGCEDFAIKVGRAFAKWQEEGGKL